MLLSFQLFVSFTRFLSTLKGIAMKIEFVNVFDKFLLNMPYVMFSASRTSKNS